MTGSDPIQSKTPSTEAGRKLDRDWGIYDPSHRRKWLDAIAAIEAEAVEAERKRLRGLVQLAIENHFRAGRHGMSLAACGEAVLFEVFGARGDPRIRHIRGEPCSVCGAVDHCANCHGKDSPPGSFRPDGDWWHRPSTDTQPEPDSQLPEDHSEIEVVPESKRDVWLTDEQKRQLGMPRWPTSETPRSVASNGYGPDACPNCYGTGCPVCSESGPSETPLPTGEVTT